MDRMFPTLRQAIIPALLLIIVVSGIAPSRGLVAAQTVDAGLVFAALRILSENHLDNPSTISLLTAALNGLRQALARVGILESLADLPNDSETNARTAFQVRLGRASSIAQGKLNETQLQHFAIVAMVESLGDRFTFFLTPEQMAERTRRDRGDPEVVVGIGVVLIQKERRVYIRRVLPQGPAARAGLRNFDRILTIDGDGVEGLALTELVQRLRRSVDTTVTMTVQRPGQTGTLSFEVTREPFVSPPAEQAMLEDQIGYILLPRRSSGTAGHFRRTLEEIQRQGMRGLVFDLRGNIGGGPSTELVAVAEMMLPTGSPIYAWHTRRDGRVSRNTQATPVIDRSKPVAILVDGGTGGISVLLAAAVQELRRGNVVGVRTTSVGPGINLFSLPGGAGLQVKTARLFSATGRDLETSGLEPDVVVDLTMEDLDRGVDAQVQRAVQIIRQTNR